ncbi:MAG: biopolymer transporter ExbD [Treponema sp.]|nr:biopolymer transporter ExbD [Treponema sp.]MDD7534502.1 biopolymer transporter ExbD [Treponema sp.]MDY3721025.1 biopolymer transporter ExbD [Treponema sp.]MDY5758007.1 biopolymer transporter ExbD [Treponema sp.]
MKFKNKREGIRSNVDMTPMIDIVFQLILFFLVSTTFATLPGIKLNLPQSHTAESTSLMGITITADDSGVLYFNDKEVSMAGLGEELLTFDTGTTKKEEFPVSLEADSEVTNGTIVKIFDVIRESGYCVINLRTTAEK